MNREEAQMVAFQLISYAGDAFSSFFKAVEKQEMESLMKLMS